LSNKIPLIQFKAGEIIFAEGDVSDGLYILESGEVEVIKGETIVASIDKKHSFFGEMSYLIKNARTATMRAKTDVKAILVDLSSDDAEVSKKLAKTSLSLLRSMATRLDLANQELLRLERANLFQQLCYEQNDTPPEVIQFLKNVEEQVHSKKVHQSNQLVQDYLLSPRFLSLIKSATVEIISFYGLESTVTKMATYEAEKSSFGKVSALNFSGNKSGTLYINISESLNQAMMDFMGLQDSDEAMKDDMVRELSNGILGQLKKKVQAYAIMLSTPESIATKDDLLKRLKENPALCLTIETEKGNMELLFQIDLKSKTEA